MALVVEDAWLLLDESVGQGELDWGLQVGLRVGEVAEDGGTVLLPALLHNNILSGPCYNLNFTGADIESSNREGEKILRS